MNIVLNGKAIKLSAHKGTSKKENRLSVEEQIEKVKKTIANYISSHGFMTIGQLNGILSKGSAKILKSSIKTAINQMIDSRTIEAITHRWGGQKSIRLVFSKTSIASDVDSETLVAHFDCVTDLVMKYINVNGFITIGIINRIFTTSRRINKKHVPICYVDQMVSKMISDGLIKKIDHIWNGRTTVRFVSQD